MDSRQGGGIDLHIHSTASDGTHSPNEIVEMAARAGLRAISITDHDTLDGTRAAYHSELPPGLGFITGVEISVQAPNKICNESSLHILGYGVDPDNTALCKALDKFQDVRKLRIHRIVERLQELGIALELEQVLKEAGDGAAGRPHVAEAMVKAGHATNINDAFDRYLGNGRPACVGKERMACRDAFDFIAGADGVPVLAHPYLVAGGKPDCLVELLRHLCDLGLKGIEVYYPKHTKDAVHGYLDLAEKFNLSVTGGTDFHGALIPDILMGQGSGDLHVPFTLYEDLLSRHSIKYAR